MSFHWLPQPSRWLGRIFTSPISLTTTRSAKVAILGLDNAGKTTILYWLKLEGVAVTRLPTIGWNEEDYHNSGVDFNFRDIGGQEFIRPLWRLCLNDVSAVIFVVDSSDRERVAEGRRELYRYVLLDDRLSLVPLLIFASKQDLPNAMNIAEVSEELGLQFESRRPTRVQGCSAKAGGAGLAEGMQWLAKEVKRRVKNQTPSFLRLEEEDCVILERSAGLAPAQPNILTSQRQCTPTAQNEWWDNQDQKLGVSAQDDSKDCKDRKLVSWPPTSYSVCDSSAACHTTNKDSGLLLGSFQQQCIRQDCSGIEYQIQTYSCVDPADELYEPAVLSYVAQEENYLPTINVTVNNQSFYCSGKTATVIAGDEQHMTLERSCSSFSIDSYVLVSHPSP